MDDSTSPKIYSFGSFCHISTFSTSLIPSFAECIIAFRYIQKIVYVIRILVLYDNKNIMVEIYDLNELLPSVVDDVLIKSRQNLIIANQSLPFNLFN